MGEVKKLFEVSFYETQKVTRVVAAEDEAEAQLIAANLDRVIDERTQECGHTPETEWDVRFLGDVPDDIDAEDYEDFEELQSVG